MCSSRIDESGLVTITSPGWAEPGHELVVVGSAAEARGKFDAGRDLDALLGLLETAAVEPDARQQPEQVLD